MAGHTLGWWIAAMMLLLTGCQYDVMVSELREEGSHDTVAISFGNGVIDNPVRTRSFTLLSQHTSTMGVWGWQTSKENVVECAFRNKEVTFNPDLGLWTYSPAKYWEEGSNYRFYAYAPHSGSANGASVTINEETGFISIDSVVLNGDNTMDSIALPAPMGSFKTVGDIDWMIDRMGQIVPKERIRTRVTFNMQHILAKFNVMAVATGAISNQGSTVVIDSLSIGDFLSKGSFIQKLDHTPVAGVEADDTVREWTIDTIRPRYTLHGTHGAVVTADGCCVIESLLLPQQVTPSQQVRINYSIHSDNGRSEHFTYLFKLNEAFSGFSCSNSYTLNLIIGPDVITFDSGTTDWDNEPDRHSWIN